MDQVKELETAILQRADRLAAEYRTRAERSRDNILSEAHERLRLREEREVLLAKAQAERAYRRKVQANELTFHREMDHLRWNLVRGVEQRLGERMKAFIKDQAAYDKVLQGYLAQGAALIEQDAVVAELNVHDHQRLEPSWAEFAAAAVPDKRILLAPEAINTLGGVLIRSEDGRIRLDNTFEGRMERLKSRLHQIIVERLIPASADSGTMLTM